MVSAHTTSGDAMEAEIRIICVAFTGLEALAAVSAHAAPYPIQQNWQPLARAACDLRAGRSNLRGRLASSSPARLARRLVVGSVRAQ